MAVAVAEVAEVAEELFFSHVAVAEVAEEQIVHN